jgi:hypothetical protein
MKKIGFIVLAVVLALGAMGAAYAAWGQNLVFSGSVATGTYVVNLTNVTALSDANHVATLTATGPGPEVASTVVAANLYPGATETVTFKIANTGSIPAKINAVQYTGVPSWVTISDDVTTVTSGVVGAGATSGTCTLTITMPDTGAGQLDQGHTAISFTFTIPTAQQY